MNDKRKLFTEQLIAYSNEITSPYLLSNLQYNKMLIEFRIANEKTTKNTSYEYKLLERYSISKINDIEKLIEKQSDGSENIRYVIPIEQIYD